MDALHHPTVSVATCRLQFPDCSGQAALVGEAGRGHRKSRLDPQTPSRMQLCPSGRGPPPNCLTLKPKLSPRCVEWALYY